MKAYQQVKIFIAAVIVGFHNAFVNTALGDKVYVGHDWLTLHSPVEGDYLVALGGGNYDLVRAADAADWEEVDVPPEVEVWVVSNGEILIDLAGKEAEEPDDLAKFPTEDEANNFITEMQLPKEFYSVEVDKVTYESEEVVAAKQLVITNGEVWMNPKGGKTKKLKNARRFDNEDDARDSLLDGEMPDGFYIETIDTPV